MIKLLNCKTVALMLDISLPTLCRMVSRKEIPHVLVRPGKSKRVVKFREADLEAWIASRVQGPETHRRRGKNRNSVATQDQPSDQVSVSPSENGNAHLSERQAPQSEGKS